MTMYRHFRSKDDLVLEFLRQREERWTRGWLQSDIDRRAVTPQERLLAIFDVFDEWFQMEPFEGCSFINVLLECANRGSRLRQAAQRYLANVRAYLARLASEAGMADPDAFARKWHILMKGAIVSAQEGDRDAAKHAREMARTLLLDVSGKGQPDSDQ